MNPYILAAIMTLQIAMVTFMRREESNYVKALVIFLIVLVNSCIFNKAHASENTYHFHKNSSIDIECFMKSFDPKGFLTPQKRAHYTALRDDHKLEADYALKAAKNKIWFLPDLEERDPMKYCWQAAGAAALPGTPMSKLCSIIILTLLQYGQDCSSEWQYISYQLHSAEYNYEMYEFYDEILKNG